MSTPIRILMLEDTPSDAELIQHTLQKGGLNFEKKQVETETSFLEALESFQPDLILSDYQLPDYDSFKALQAAQAFDPDIPFIFVTDASEEEATVHMLKQGAVDYILKDRLARLPEAVNRAIENALHQTQLRASEERYHLLMQSCHYGIWDWDLTSDTLFLSPQWKQQLGYLDHELVNSFSTFKRLLHPEDRGSLIASLKSFIVANKDHWNVEFRMLHKSGNYRWINARGSHKTDEEGRVIRMLGVHIDVTQHHQSQEKLRQAAQVFSSTIEGVIITDAEPNILSVNPAFERITGYRSEQVIGHNLRILQSGHQSDDFYQSLWQTLLSEGHWSGEIWNRRADGNNYPSLTTISTVKDDSDRTTGYVCLFTDITQLKQSEERLDFLAHHDTLTGLPNRLLFKDRLTKALQHANRKRNKVAVMFIDLDRFKNVNDSLGHTVGDELLKQVSQRLKQSTRDADTLARISGDEFVLMIEDSFTVESTTNVLNKIMEAFRKPFKLKRHQVLTTCSIGVSVFPDDAHDTDELVSNADAAMYRAKNVGRNTYEFYTPEMTASALEHIFLENALHNAIPQKQFVQYYQPQYQLDNGQLIGCETLIRWQHPLEGIILPQRFITLAEQNGTIRDIDFWMLKTACQQGKIWHDRGLAIPRISVNMAGSQIQRENFATSVHKILKETNFPREHLEIEVTESFIMQRPEIGIWQLQKLYDDGISIAIDDFGTGHSSLNYLKKLPVSKIKLDQSFIKDITEDKDTLAIVRAVTDMAKSLGKTIIAEGVETVEQAELLKELGCEQVQGFYFGRPVELGIMTEVLSQSRQISGDYQATDSELSARYLR
jgi:diguanylate cyclase (GGDEF)-like protein/PAS domain S-box-containing protein